MLSLRFNSLPMGEMVTGSVNISYEYLLNQTLDMIHLYSSILEDIIKEVTG